MTDARPDGEGPDDPFVSAVAEHWDEILGLADDEQRERLRELVAATAELDPADARAALSDELLDLLPPDHPVIEVLRTGVMYGNMEAHQVEARLAGAMRWLSLQVLPEGARDDGPASIEMGAPADGRGTAEPDSGVADDFDRQVEIRLLDLPSLSSDEVRRGHADPDDNRLIRLPRPDHTVQLPSFQFTPAGTAWPIVQEVNAILSAMTDPWGVTCWWVDPHEGLAVAPVDLIGRGHDHLLRRAAAAVGEEY